MGISTPTNCHGASESLSQTDEAAMSDTAAGGLPNLCASWAALCELSAWVLQLTAVAIGSTVIHKHLGCLVTKAGRRDVSRHPACQNHAMGTHSNVTQCSTAYSSLTHAYLHLLLRIQPWTLLFQQACGKQVEGSYYSSIFSTQEFALGMLCPAFPSWHKTDEDTLEWLHWSSPRRSGE